MQFFGSSPPRVAKGNFIWGASRGAVTCPVTRPPFLASRRGRAAASCTPVRDIGLPKAAPSPMSRATALMSKGPGGCQPRCKPLTRGRVRARVS